MMTAQQGVSTLFSQTSSLSYTGTTPTSLFGAGTSDRILQQAFWTVGKQLRIKGRGIYTTTSLSPSVSIVLKLGSVSSAAAGVTNLVNNATNAGFSFEETITCRSVGASGTFAMDGSLSFSTGAGLIGAVYLNNGGALLTADTTAQMLLDLIATWGQTGNTVVVTQASIEALN